MPLPKIATPTYELVLPSSDRKIKYRPFLVKEEKILIIAMESEDQKQITNAIKSVINNCILSRGIKVDKLSTFDIEYLFLNIRGKSVGENVEVLITCPDDEKTQVPVMIPLDEIKIQKHPDHNKDIKLDDKLTMRMKYPSLSEFIKSNIVGVYNLLQNFKLYSRRYKSKLIHLFYHALNSYEDHLQPSLLGPYHNPPNKALAKK